FVMDWTAVRLDGGHRLSSNLVLYSTAALTSSRRANQMHHDIHGLPISTASAQAAAAFDRVTLGYLKYRADLPVRMTELFAADGDFGLAHCLKGYFAMLSYKQANVPVAMEAMQTARRLTARATAREQAH